MAKTNGKNGNGNGSSSTRRARPRNRNLVTSVGGNPVRDYARLLACPDTGPLVHPLYSGTTEGYLIRVRKVVTQNLTPQESANQSVIWTPGDPRRPIEIYHNTSNFEPDTVGSIADNPLIETGFPINAARCVAAQLEAKYVGREIDRSGLGSCGQLVVNATPGSGTVNNGWNITGSTQTRPPGAIVAEHVTDHPNHLVVKWRPTAVDAMWVTIDDPPSLLPQPDGRIQNPSLFTTIEGADADNRTPYAFIFTAVYEWKPRQAAAIANVPTKYTAIRATVADAISMASRAGTQWASSLLQDAASTLPAMMMAYAGRRAYQQRIEL